MNGVAIVTRELIDETLAELRAANDRERVLLWIGRRTTAGAVVERIYVPEQEAGADYFHIPPEALRALFASLASTRSMVVAQVHTHPLLAFHSAADDHWAIVRHRGALSLVVPYFAQRTTGATFVADAAVFQIDDQGLFAQVGPHHAYRVQP